VPFNKIGFGSFAEASALCVDASAELTATESNMSSSDTAANNAQDMSDSGGMTIENDEGTEIINWKFLGTTLPHAAHNTLQNVLIPPPPNPEFETTVVNMPGFAEPAKWTAAGVNAGDIPTRLYNVRIQLFEGPGAIGTPITSITSDAIFVPSVNYLEEKKGVWRFGFDVPTNLTTGNFHNAHEFSLKVRFYISTEDPATTLMPVDIKKKYKFELD
jgi:hypothetical protein